MSYEFIILDSLGVENDFSELLAALHALVGGARLGQGEGGIDHRPQPPLEDELEHFEQLRLGSQAPQSALLSYRGGIMVGITSRPFLRYIVKCRSMVKTRLF